MQSFSNVGYYSPKRSYRTEAHSIKQVWHTQYLYLLPEYTKPNKDNPAKLWGCVCSIWPTANIERSTGSRAAFFYKGGGNYNITQIHTQLECIIQAELLDAGILDLCLLILYQLISFNIGAKIIKNKCTSIGWLQDHKKNLLHRVRFIFPTSMCCLRHKAESSSCFFIWYHCDIIGALVNLIILFLFT